MVGVVTAGCRTIVDVDSMSAGIVNRRSGIESQDGPVTNADADTRSARRPHQAPPLGGAGYN
ncbi:MAG: hypothetical protein JWL94_2298 [Microbacteriaceae bacterium]|jgi:hypothetical protein|nr:hypothetical protein [Microbacteriaceae bacterium]